MNYDLDLIWKSMTAFILQEVSSDVFLRWFKAIQLAAVDDSRITLRVPTNLCKLWLQTNYLGLLQSAFQNVLGSSRSIRFTTVESPENQEAFTPNTGMHPRNTFESFVVGSCNQFAHAAALAVSRNTDKTYNPLFIYGGKGLGKTHLMHAIGQHVAATNGEAKVIYVSSEQFADEFIDAIQKSSLATFRSKYRQIDLLLIDDVQLLAGKERCQEELFQTFTALFDGHKQIILSGDRPPSEIDNLDPLLVSRFEWGLLAELQQPDLETRLTILRYKAREMNAKVDDTVLEFIARRIKSSIRRLEGALMRVDAFIFLSGRELTPATALHLLKDLLDEAAKNADPSSQSSTKQSEASPPDVKPKPRITFDE